MTEKLASLFGVSLELAQVIMPILVIHFVLALIALVDLIKNWKVRTMPIIWLFIILILNLIGPVLYFIIGRQQKHAD
ncbi:PLDc N-terminal domain-containing protein [Lactococcus paracarnosus]|uniref:Negative regulator of sigma-Y activity n=1 Tax=Pseudolactococcus paracarnosus TaxID=2749962 RepID=A0A7L4WDG8_9LACT|nr:PLDc N-terminal domain-containing protein [Lactococcus paracarnosus]SPC35284.1 conserved hypothetical protein [Lactococcus piscium]MCJ1978410.1 negative regulator of sigma-Y activity [Lactococcus paracarnosus]MCJ1984553.1 negative regulator of sigma-Y activity [Lactococcus paracarnosus]MCJ1994613.1 negative regulator of sigma-Y activity [Lactococcus paracarnosus]MCJ1999199.1 negative regulator of sigma-Y activity [Lactococcus paracarnosus]